jgi:hypothetical protein
LLPAQFQLAALLSLLTFAMSLFHVLSCRFLIRAAQDSPNSRVKVATAAFATEYR